MDNDDFLKQLEERKKKSRVYKEYQMVGLEISQILGDEKHKALYMKLAKAHDKNLLFQLAKDVADRKNIENRGAYFMKLLSDKLHGR